MDLTESLTILIFGIIAYVLIVDKNVSDYLILLAKMASINIQRFFWMVRFHPRNPITNFLKEREYSKLAKELEKKLRSND